MNWENLVKKLCPYCDHDLREDQGQFSCTACVFVIDKNRFRDIAANRSKPKATIKVRYKWQNLKHGRCPMCNDYLRESEATPSVLQCISNICTFHIQEYRMEEIVKDDAHPANRYNS